MAKKNTGKPAEKDFESYWTRLGKRAWCYRLPDQAEIFGRNKGKGGNARSQPSDYLLVHDGHTSFAEVKSTQDPTAFRFSLLRKDQSAMAAQILAAGGTYLVYVQAMLTGQWYRLPYPIVTAVRTSGKASIPWCDMEAFKCSLT